MSYEGRPIIVQCSVNKPERPTNRKGEFSETLDHPQTKLYVMGKRRAEHDSDRRRRKAMSILEIPKILPWRFVTGRSFSSLFHTIAILQY